MFYMRLVTICNASGVLTLTDRTLFFSFLFGFRPRNTQDVVSAAALLNSAPIDPQKHAIVTTLYTDAFATYVLSLSLCVSLPSPP